MLSRSNHRLTNVEQTDRFWICYQPCNSDSRFDFKVCFERHATVQHRVMKSQKVDSLMLTLFQTVLPLLIQMETGRTQNCLETQVPHPMVACQLVLTADVIEFTATGARRNAA